MPVESISAEMPRVLVVDDSAVIRQAIHKMLRSEFDLVLAGDGESGWEKLAEDRRISVLITDIEMPRLDGYAFICRIRAAEDPRIRDMPIITITGAEDDETKARAYACGATDFITKPLNAGQLQARVQAYLAFDPLHERGPEAAEGDVDELTRLYSRTAFMQQGSRLFPGQGEPVALIHLAIDGFRKLYRTHGDEVANRMLVWIARRLLVFGERNALVARIAGAEFALLYSALGQDEAMALGERIRQSFLENPFTDGALSIPLTVSLGLATPSAKATDFGLLAHLAERRLRYAESKGGNQLSVSGLEELLPSPEELVLAAPAETGTSLSTEELEDFAAHGLAVPSPVPLQEIPRELISIDRALALIAGDRASLLEPYLGLLMEEVWPLITLFARQRNLDADASLEALKTLIANPRH